MLKALLVLVLVSCVIATDFSAATQQAIVDRHNLYRGQVNPAASPAIPSVTWDSSLATYANNWASACNFAHGTNNPNGENLYSSYSSTGYPGDSAGVPAVDSWNSERPYYNYASGTCVGGECLHYTQVVWSATLRIGCAYANCPSFGTFVVCEYSPRGNFNMQTTKAWPTSGGGSSSCTPSCPSGQCGVVSSCGSQVSCPACPTGTYCPGNGGSCTACTNPCTAGVCGLRYSSTCPTTQYDCGSCSSGYSCVSNTCQATTPACTTNICTANGRNCGSFTDASCTGSVSCGTCASGQTCTNGVCVAPPCNGACSSPSQTCNTASNTCACSSGYSLVNGVCTANSNTNPVWTSDFVSLSGGASTSYPDSSTLIISGTSTTPSVLNFARSTAAYNLAWTKATAEVTQTAGSFGFGWRIGNRAGYADDGVYVYSTNIGLSNYGMNYDWKYYGGWQNPTPTPYTFSTNNWRTNGPMTVASWLVTNTTSGYSNIYMSTAYSETVNGYTTSRSASYYVTVPTQYLGSTPGTVALYSKRTGSATSVVTRFTLATSTTLSVSLYNCISDADWVTLFRSLTGCSSCTVTARATGTNGRCKAAGAGKEAAAAFIVVVESTGVAADAIATNFLAAVESGSAAAAPLAVKSASIIGGMEGAALAGFPEGAGVITTAPATGAGGGGGGAAGLSGGAIAGIVIGSVGGAALIVGVATIVVVAVVVAAVIVAKKSGDSGDSDSGPTRSEPEVNKRGSIRNTIYNIFRGPRGGVDVMNNPNGHQSITARAPKMM